MMDFLTASHDHLFTSVLALDAVSLSAYLFRGGREARRDREKLAQAVNLELKIPTSLRSMIDPGVCIGSGSFANARPE
jgi:hypothetical protein